MGSDLSLVERALYASGGGWHAFFVEDGAGEYSFDDLVRDGETIWDGIKNAQALISLRGMKKGEKLVIYHSNTGKAVVGTATVVANGVNPEDAMMPVVRIKAGKRLKREKGLAEMRESALFQDSILFRQFRLSVVPLPVEQYEWLVKG